MLPGVDPAGPEPRQDRGGQRLRDHRLPLHLTGRHLLVKSEPLSAHSVELFYGTKLDPGVVARITKNSTPGQLEVDIRARDNAKLGEHTVVVTTPAGTAENPPDKVFEIRESLTDAEAS